MKLSLTQHPAVLKRIEIRGITGEVVDLDLRIEIPVELSEVDLLPAAKAVLELVVDASHQPSDAPTKTSLSINRDLDPALYQLAGKVRNKPTEPTGEIYLEAQGYPEIKIVSQDITLKLRLRGGVPRTELARLVELVGADSLLSTREIQQELNLDEAAPEADSKPTRRKRGEAPVVVQ